MLDAVERSLQRLASANLYNKKMPMTFILDGASVFIDLDLAGVLPHIGISASIANKLKNLEAELPAPVMAAALGRAKTYLRKIESEFGDASGGTEEGPEDQAAQIEDMLESYPPPPVPVWADTWVYIKRGSRAKAIIAELSELLDEVALLARSTNLPEHEAALTDIERAQLIAVLDTAIAMLKGPMVEQGLLKKLGKMSKETAQKAAQKNAEQGLGEGMLFLARKLSELISYFL
jgi:hypothetical protein